MSIFPLPVFEADADPRHRSAMGDEELYERLEPPKTIVVRFGHLKLVAEYPYEGDAKPGCGTRLVARTHRGTEVVEMLTTTCENAGCSKSVTRQEMMDYIDNSGGKEYPFHQQGKILRVATLDDLNKQSALNSKKTEYIASCKREISELSLAMKLVDVEPILGEELLTFYFMSQDRVDFRELVRRLAAEFKSRIEMRQVGARDEARLVADYERCGQHCCCKSFLKVLKPVSMKAAKLQKATLDPLKISGRCGRLMCCLRYEDQSYRDLKKRLPPRNSRVGTNEGPGVVVDGKVLVQLVLVRLEDDREIAVAVEDLCDPETCPRPAPPEPVRERPRPGQRQPREARGPRPDDKGPTDRTTPGDAPAEPDPLRGLSEQEAAKRAAGEPKRGGRRRRRGRTKGERQDDFAKRAEAEVEGQTPAEPAASDATPTPPAAEGTPSPSKRRRRRRRRRRKEGKE